MSKAYSVFNGDNKETRTSQYLGEMEVDKRGHSRSYQYSLLLYQICPRLANDSESLLDTHHPAGSTR